MVKKLRVTDEAIRELLEKDFNMKGSHIAKELGIQVCGQFYDRVSRIRNEMQAEPKKDPIPEVKQPESTGIIKAFPFDPKDDVIFGGQLHRVSTVDKTRMVMYRNSDLKSVTILWEDYKTGNIEIRKTDEKKPMNIKTSGTRFDGLPDACKKKIADKLKSDAKQFEGERATEIENAADEILMPQKDMDRLSEAYAKVKSDRKPATINPDFEAAVQDMIAMNEAKEEAIINSAPNDVNPISLDLDEPDYIDPEWGVIEFQKMPKKGIVELAIWEQAYAKIEKYHSLQETLKEKINTGQSLPVVLLNEYEELIQAAER